MAYERIAPDGSMRVSITDGDGTEITNFGGTTVGAAAHDAPISGNPVRIGGRARTSSYTAVANDDTADIMVDTVGKQIVKPYAIPDSDWTYASNIIPNAAGDRIVKAAAGAGLRNYITACQIYTDGKTTASHFVITDGPTGSPGTVLFRLLVGTTSNPDFHSYHFPTPLRTSANTAVYVNVPDSGSTYNVVNMQGYVAP